MHGGQHLSLILSTFHYAIPTTRFNSTCADVYVDALRGVVTVMFNNSTKCTASLTLAVVQSSTWLLTLT